MAKEEKDAKEEREQDEHDAHVVNRAAFATPLGDSLAATLDQTAPVVPMSG